MIAVVVDLLIVPVAHIDRSLWTDLDIHWTKPSIVAGHRPGDVERSKRGPIGSEFTFHNPALERLDAKKLALIPRRQCAMIVDEKIMSESGNVVVRHWREVPEGIWIR